MALAGGAGLLLAAWVASSGRAAEGCKAKVNKGTGIIEVSAKDVDAPTLRWGPQAGQETLTFFDPGCVAGGKAKKCLLGDPAGLGARTPPEGCSVFVADALGSCSAWIGGCTPGLRGGAPVERVIQVPAEAINSNPMVTRGTVGLTWPALVAAAGSLVLPMPDDWDGASDFRVALLFTTSTATAGAVDFFLRVTGRNIGEELFDPGSLDSDAAVPNTGSEQLHRQEFTVPASSLDPADAVLHIFGIQRGGTNETYPGDVILRAIEIRYTGLR